MPGLKVGHFTDSRRPTGCTVVLCGSGAVAGVDVRGAAPGTRETDLLDPVNLVDKVHALVLGGGSAFGLDAATGVMRWLEARGIGLPVGPSCVPIVPAAVLFDLGVGDGRIRPDAAAGEAACAAASEAPVAQGSVGAGAGALVGKLFGAEHAMKGGMGSASLQVDGVTIAALIAVNAVGDVVDPRSGRVLAGARSPDGLSLPGSTERLALGELPRRFAAGGATTIGVVATDAVLNKVQATKMAAMSHDGLARTIDPAHTMSDGDTMFALATGASGRSLPLTVLGALAARVAAQAVLNAIEHATGLPGWPSAREWRGR